MNRSDTWSTRHSPYSNQMKCTRKSNLRYHDRAIGARQVKCGPVTNQPALASTLLCFHWQPGFTQYSTLLAIADPGPFHHVTRVDGRCHFDPELLRRRGNDRHFRPPLRNREALRGAVGRAVIDDLHAAGTGRVRGHGASPLGRRRVGLHLLAEAINRIAAHLIVLRSASARDAQLPFSRLHLRNGGGSRCSRARGRVGGVGSGRLEHDD